MTIYVVVSYGGEYDDAWENNEVASHDFSKAQQFVFQKEEAQDYLTSCAELVRVQDEQYMKTNPRPKDPAKFGTWNTNLIASRTSLLNTFDLTPEEVDLLTFWPHPRDVSYRIDEVEEL